MSFADCLDGQTVQALSPALYDLHHGDCLQVLKTLADNSVDSVVTDPPYGLEFMGREWDTFKQTPNAWATRDKSEDSTGKSSSPFLAAAVNKYQAGRPFQEWCEQWAREVLRVLKPGGHLAAFGGTRTYHRMTCAIEDAGFEIRDCIFWTYGVGFPKSHNIGKALDASKERCTCNQDMRVLRRNLDAEESLSGGQEQNLRANVLCGDDVKGESRPDLRPPADADGVRPSSGPSAAQQRSNEFGTVAGQSESQERGAWDHCDRCGKPIVPDGLGSALKPAVEPAVLARKPLSEKSISANVLRWGTGAINVGACKIGTEVREYKGGMGRFNEGAQAQGFRPYVNGVPSHSAETFTATGRWPANLCHDGSQEVLDLFPESKGQQGDVRGDEPSSAFFGQLSGRPAQEARNDSGSAARFFYCAKASKADRAGSRHPTVKPIKLMQWLVRLITPPTRLVCPQCARLEYGKSLKTKSCDPSLRTVRDGIQASRQPAQGSILQQAVCERGHDVGEEKLRDVRSGVSADQFGATMLREGVRLPLGGEAQEKPQAVSDDEAGLQTNLCAGSPEHERRICVRTPPDCREESRTLSDQCGSSTSYQSYQVGQSGREPSTDAEGRSRQTESSASEHAYMPPLPRADRDEPSCPNCGSVLERIGGVVLDPFAGSGTTGAAAILEGFRPILIEREDEYVADIRKRLAA